MIRVLEHPNGYLCRVTALYDAKGNKTEDLLHTVAFDYIDRLVTEHGTIVEGSADRCIHSVH